MVEVVQMSMKEADRYAVIQQVIQRTRGQSDAALWLNISVRQVKRLARAIRQDGAQGAVSTRWGVPSNRRLSQAVRDQFAGLMQVCFYPVESTNAYLHSLQCYVSAHGRPQALYSDRHSIFTKHDPEDPAPTQFERAAGCSGTPGSHAWALKRQPWPQTVDWHVAGKRYVLYSKLSI